jgi:hypothetical protein
MAAAIGGTATAGTTTGAIAKRGRRAAVQLGGGAMNRALDRAFSPRGRGFGVVTPLGAARPAGPLKASCRKVEASRHDAWSRRGAGGTGSSAAGSER